MQNKNVLILPGWSGSGPLHWQSLWAQQFGYKVVEQHDWIRPLRGDWLARLEEVLADLSAPVYLVAHSLGCIQVAAWAGLSTNTHKVQGALLVAPADIEAPHSADVLSSWRPIEMQPLPFRACVVASQNDPFCATERAQDFAKAWRANLIHAGSIGHVNADSQLDDWPEGRAVLNDFMKEKEDGH